MSLTLPVGGGGGGDFKRVPAGTHLAICVIVADLGIQPGSAMYPDPKRKIHLRFEIPNERVEYDRDGKMVNMPAAIGKDFTASMNEKATLRKFLEGWRGRQFTDEEAGKFDLSSVLGKPCLLSISESDRGGETYSNIANASPLIKGMAAPPPENEPILYTASSPTHVFDKLPKRLKEKVQGQLAPQTEDQAMERAASEYAPPESSDYKDW
jgi:hypothetical protein